MGGAYPTARPGYAGLVTTRSRRLPDALAVPDPARLDPARPDYQAILAAHGRALAAGEDGYLDPATGRWSFTAAFLWERGTCCDSGCRHCPYVNQRARLAGRGGSGRPPG
jgi:hypothetical protein